MMDLGNDFQVGTLRARTTGPSPPSVRLSVTRALRGRRCAAARARSA
ncbi:MAG: hypothetical protein MZW92_40790 [Comamonadaceae bacterium]|nr:hypothetical protein [Comamonadaceae bacterium]